MQDKLKPLFDLIITEEDRNSCLQMLDDFVLNLYKSGPSAQDTIEDNARFGQTVLQLLPKGYKDVPDKSGLAKIVSELKEKIKALQTVKLIIAFPPTGKIINLLGSFEASFPQKVVFDVDVKPDILGGAVFIINGRYHDYSLLSKLNDAFEEKREEIFSVIPTDKKADSHGSA